MNRYQQLGQLARKQAADLPPPAEWEKVMPQIPQELHADWKGYFQPPAIDTAIGNSLPLQLATGAVGNQLLNYGLNKQEGHRHALAQKGVDFLPGGSPNSFSRWDAAGAGGDISSLKPILQGGLRDAKLLSLQPAGGIANLLGRLSPHLATGARVLGTALGRWIPALQGATAALGEPIRWLAGDKTAYNGQYHREQMHGQSYLHNVGHAITNPQWSLKELLLGGSIGRGSSPQSGGQAVPDYLDAAFGRSAPGGMGHGGKPNLPASQLPHHVEHR